MGIKIKNLPALSGLPEDGDYFAVTDESVTSKVNFTQLAQALIEDYDDSTLGGAPKSVKDVIDEMYDDLTQTSADVHAIDTYISRVSTAETTYSSAFTEYSSGANPHFYKYGKVAMVYGTAKPSATITGGTDLVEMFEFPSGYTPAGRLVQMQQASGARLWTLTLQNGKAYFSRCRDGNAWYSATTSEWLPFNAVYIIG